MSDGEGTSDAAEVEQQHADLESHHIEGFTMHGNHRLSIPLISEVLPGLWQGGCIHRVRLPDDFTTVVSLYKWEQYALGPDTARTEVEAYDGHEVPEVGYLARYVHERWKAGEKVLVHCQAGLNRSGLTVAQVLMLEGYPAGEAIELLRATRSPAVLCNPTFTRYLLQLEEVGGEE